MKLFEAPGSRGPRGPLGVACPTVHKDSLVERPKYNIIQLLGLWWIYGGSGGRYVVDVVVDILLNKLVHKGETKPTKLGGRQP